MISIERLEKLAEHLLEENITIAFAESVTTGKAASMLGRIEGISKVLIGSVVCYQSKAKETLLDISPELIEKHSDVSQEVTDAMAKNLYEKVKPDIAVAITGLTSSAVEWKYNVPVGTVFLSIIYEGNLYDFREHFDFTSREAVRQNAVDFAISHLLRLLLIAK